ncbi:MAG: DNA polymerase Y family protein [Rhodobacteraceae bacterium]|nr:DNA polymerase Y family protein [Paracoccaceae bacterium]
MPRRRILSLWFPHLAAERVLRNARGRVTQPLAIVAQNQNAQTIANLSPEACTEGLFVGQSLSDARAFCPELLTAPANLQLEDDFLVKLRRWAGKYSPWVSQEPPASLVLDISGCAHLFGGEAALAEQVHQDLQALHLTARLGVADTVGAAWALARFAGKGAQMHRSGDAIDQEARATRARAVKRRNWERGGPAPSVVVQNNPPPDIAAPGKTRDAIGRLPVAALRLSPDVCTNLNRLGLRIVADLAGLPRASVARRFGRHVVQRLDQALGSEPEPVSPAAAPLHFATRLSLPDPIGLQEDLAAGFDRLLGPLCDKLRLAGRGTRKLRLTLFRTDHTMQLLEIGLARPSHDPDRIRPMMTLRLPDADAGFGIDVMRLQAFVTEPLTQTQHSGHAGAMVQARRLRDDDAALADLLGRIGARCGLESMTRLHPADSHIPEKTVTEMAAAYVDGATGWQVGPLPRPIFLFPPEALQYESTARPPTSFRWRNRAFHTRHAVGPERIAPEWWLDDPNWRSGTRDYWQVGTDRGDRLWLFQTKGPQAGGWFCQGCFG